MMRIMGVLERMGGWSFQAKHVLGVENVLADGETRWKEDEIQTRLTAERPTVSWKAQELGVEGTEMCTEVLRAATHSDELRSRQGRPMRKVGQLEGYTRKGELVGVEMNEWELVDELMEFVGYCCMERKNKHVTVAAKLIAMIFYHELWVGLSLPLHHFRIKAVRKGVKKAHVEAGNQTRVRRPLAGEMTRVMEESIGEWGLGGKIAWIRLVWLCRTRCL